MGNDGGVDADQFAAVIHQRSAGISGIDRGVGLNEIFVLFDPEMRPSGGAHDAHGDRLANAEGIANSQGVVANLDFRRVGNGDAGQVGGVNLQYGDVAFRIGSDDFGLELSFTGQR